MTDEEMIAKAREMIADGCGCDRTCTELVGSDDYCGCEEDAKRIIALVRGETD